MSPQVSVIVPAYNYGRYLTETVESLIRQTLSNWECILVDDGSTDETQLVVASLNDARIRYHYQRNSGLAAARNVGLALAAGSYVQFLDADDLLAAEKLEHQVDVLGREPDVDVCYSNYRPFDSSTGHLMERWTERMLGGDPLQDFLLRWELDLCIPIHCGLFRRALWPGGAPFDRRLTAKEDWLFWIDLTLGGARFHFLDRDYAFYRMHDRNMSRDHAEMAASLLEATLRISSRIPETYREDFIGASRRRLRRSLDHWSGSLECRREPIR